MPNRNCITLIYGDGDYSPVLVLDEEGRSIFTGDNMHNRGYEQFAMGYAEAKGLEVQEIFIDTLEEVEAIKPLLVATKSYADFRNYYRDMGGY